MPLLKPFRALRYDEAAAGPLDDLVAPPYDVITPEGLERLLARSPWNVVRVVRPDDPEDAARLLAEWRAHGVLVREARPAVWLLEESYTGPDGVPRTRRGVVARVRVGPYDDGVVLPHEGTFSAPKEARLRLLRATGVKPSPIFLLHHGRSPGPGDGPPTLEAQLDGVVSRLWRVDEPEAIEHALAGVEGPLLIADGHHRYETALRYHEEEETEETAHVLAVLVGTHDEGLEIFPTHRLTAGAVPELNGGLRQTPLAGAAEAAGALAAVGDRPAFVLLRPDGASLVEGSEHALDTAFVDSLPLSEVAYTASAAEAERAVTSGAATAAFLVRAPTVAQVEEFARAGVRMPAKSTYFYPKLTSGLLLSPFDE